MRAYYLGIEKGNQNDPKKLLFVKTWVMRANNDHPDVKVVALVHPCLVSAARQSPKAVHDGILELVGNSTGITCVNVLQGIFERMSPSEFRKFFEEERGKVNIGFYVPMSVRNSD